MTRQRSMLEYLASLRQHGCQPQNIGTVTIGRTVYSAGSFEQDGRQKRIALMPIYRRDWVNHRSTGPTPHLLPASYRRNRRTVFATYDSTFYISGWSEDEGILWLNLTDGNATQWIDYQRQSMEIHFREPFDVALSLASDEVLARIAAQAPVTAEELIDAYLSERQS